MGMYGAQDVASHETILTLSKMFDFRRFLHPFNFRVVPRSPEKIELIRRGDGVSITDNI